MSLFSWLKRMFTPVDFRTPPPPPDPPRFVPPGRVNPGPSTAGSTSDGARSPLTRPAPRPSALDPGDFAPLRRDAVQAGANQLGLKGFFGFEPRDRIPSTANPRTVLLDRAVAGHGLLTPEDLAEMHRAGEQMDELRPRLDRAHRAADAAVVRSREERAGLKAAKKAGAAARQTAHAEAVAHRHATDIVFLGRGVSRGLADRTANVEKLTAANLPVLGTPAEVAAALGIAVPRLRWLAFHNETASRVHYVSFTVPKRNGGERQLHAPHRELAACQEWVWQNILARVPVHDAAHGFVPGRSTVTHARLHVGRALVVNLDLENFFPTVTFPRVGGIFRALGYSPAAATILALLTTECPRREVTHRGETFHVAVGPRALPQGACSSPSLSNLAARRLDARLSGLAARLGGWTYSRYADDLTFSAADRPAAARAGALLASVRVIIAAEGFRPNEAKTRGDRPHTAQTVTGIVVNARPGVPRETVRRLRAILHRARTEGLEAQNREDRPDFAAWLDGMIAYVSMVNPEQGRPLREAREALGDSEARTA